MDGLPGCLHFQHFLKRVVQVVVIRHVFKVLLGIPVAYSGVPGLSPSFSISDASFLQMNIVRGCSDCSKPDWSWVSGCRLQLNHASAPADLLGINQWMDGYLSLFLSGIKENFFHLKRNISRNFVVEYNQQLFKEAEIQGKKAKEGSPNTRRHTFLGSGFREAGRYFQHLLHMTMTWSWSSCLTF